MATSQGSVSHGNYLNAIFLLLIFSLSCAKTGLGYVYQSTPFNRSSFPPGFLFGAASSAYQYEGAAFEGGRGPSIWDTYIHQFPEKITDRTNGDVANNFYNLLYKANQKGKIGITLVTHWFVPYSSSRLDVKAAQRALDFVYGWFIHPVVYGNYPRSMQNLVGDRLPKFTKEQTAMVKDSFDFLGLNYYTGNYAAHVFSHSGNVSSTSDSRTHLTSELEIGEPSQGWYDEAAGQQ